MTRQLDIFPGTGSGNHAPSTKGSDGRVRDTPVSDEAGLSVASASGATPGGSIHWPVWPQYKTDYDVDRPPFGVAEGWDHMVHVVRQRDALRRKARP